MLCYYMKILYRPGCMLKENSSPLDDFVRFHDKLLFTQKSSSKNLIKEHIGTQREGGIYSIRHARALCGHDKIRKKEKA